MKDFEKVSYGLRCMCYGDVECEECPYAKDGSAWHSCRSNCAKDALELQKEKIAKPILIREGKSKWYNDYRCSRCDQDISYEQNYCCECGSKIDWSTD